MTLKTLYIYIYIYIYIYTEGGTPIAAQNAVGKLIYNRSWSKT
jgi:hypothetical protein